MALRFLLSRREAHHARHGKTRGVKAIATISNMLEIAAVIDLANGDMQRIPALPQFTDNTIIDSNPCRPFGITWCGDELYIANNRQLLAYDSDFRYLGTHDTPLHENTHQLCARDGRIWAVSPRTNSLIGVSVTGDTHFEFDIFRQTIKPYEARLSQETDDLKHVNSILWSGDALFVAAHNFGPSFIMEFDAGSFSLRRVIRDVGGSIHGLGTLDGELFWIDTEGNAVRSSGGYHQRLYRDGFARGFAMTDDVFIVGISEVTDRRRRINGDAFVQVIDRRSGTMLAEHRLEGTGNINDLRLLDEFDLAHGALSW